jgi:hypothetical protein
MKSKREQLRRRYWRTNIIVLQMPTIRQSYNSILLPAASKSISEATEVNLQSQNRTAAHTALEEASDYR